MGEGGDGGEFLANAVLLTPTLSRGHVSGEATRLRGARAHISTATTEHLLDFFRYRSDMPRHRDINRMRAGAAGDEDADLFGLLCDRQQNIARDFAEFGTASALRAAEILGRQAVP